MRVSPVGFAFTSEDEMMLQARMTAEITHNHPEGVRGAEATAPAVFLARTGSSKEIIRAHITSLFEYNLDFKPLSGDYCDEITQLFCQTGSD